MNQLQRIHGIFVKYKRKINRTIVRNLTNAHENRIKLKVLFFGSDHFSLASLIRLYEVSKTSPTVSKLDIVTRGDSNLITKFAKSNQLECYKWPIAADVVKEKNYDVGVVVSFGHMIPEDVIVAFPLSVGMINVHGSLLPRWRGASPIIHSILNEDSMTGLSIMAIKPKHFDIGDVLAQTEVPVPKNVLMSELYAVMAERGAKLLVECISNLPEYLRNAKPQSNENASYAPRVTDSMAEINWTQMTGKYIFNLYRALYSFKHLTTTWQKQNVQIFEIENCDNLISEPNWDASRPGTITFVKNENSLHVKCADGSIVKIIKLQLEGRKMLLARDFNNGYLKKVNVYERYFE